MCSRLQSGAGMVVAPSESAMSEAPVLSAAALRACAGSRSKRVWVRDSGEQPETCASYLAGVTSHGSLADSVHLTFNGPVGDSADLRVKFADGVIVRYHEPGYEVE